MAAPPSNNAGNSGCLIPLGVLFSLAGIVFGISALSGAKGYENPQQKMMGAGVSFAVLIIGMAAIAAGRSAAGAARKAKAAAADAPDRPWLWRPDWAKGYAEPEWQSEAAGRGIAGLLILLISSFTLAGALKQPVRGPHYVLLLVLILPLFGLFLIGQSFLIRLRERKFRQVRLMLPRLPGVLGGRLEGRLESAFSFPPDSQIRLTLSCVRSYDSGSGSHSRWENVLWQTTQVTTPYVETPGSSAPIDFTIPFDARETDASNPADEIFWRLSAAASLAGLDFRARFKVPVFRTESSDASLSREKIEAGEMALLAGGKPSDAKIRTGGTNGGALQFHLGPARNKPMAWALSLFGLIFITSGIFWTSLFRDTYTWFVGAIPLVLSGTVGLVLLALAVGLWCRKTDVSVAGRSLLIRSRCLGFSRSRNVNADQIRKFERRPAMQYGDLVWYDLRAHLGNGRAVTIATELEKSEAEWFEAQLKKDLGI